MTFLLASIAFCRVEAFVFRDRGFTTDGRIQDLGLEVQDLGFEFLGALIQPLAFIT